jgi:hypothetical protein
LSGLRLGNYGTTVAVGDNNTDGPSGARDEFSVSVSAIDIDFQTYDARLKFEADTDENDDEIAEAFPAGAVQNEEGVLTEGEESADEAEQEAEAYEDEESALYSEQCGNSCVVLDAAAVPAPPSPALDFGVEFTWWGGPMEKYAHSDS